MEPTIATNEMITASNLVTPAQNTIVEFEKNPYLEENQFNIPSKKSIHISRIIALENETIEIRDGEVFINNKQLKHTFEIYNLYKINSNDLKTYQSKYDLKTVTDYNPNSNFQFVNLNKSKAEQLAIESQISKFDTPIESSNLYQIDAIVKSSWSANNFGPIKVPTGSYFTLCDNRNNSIDSRIYGFVKKEDIIVVKL